jgi:HlyD family secretion protein
VQVKNPDTYLRPDMNATVNFYNDAPASSTAESKRVIVIPRSAIQNGSVFVVLNGRARKRAVTTGGSSDKGVMVESGLIGGEDLIVSPPADLKDGQRVEVKQ